MSEENSTVSQDIIKKSNQKITITDDLGRAIVLRKPKFSHYLDLIKAVGPELSKNAAYIENISIISTVVSINGEPMPLKTVGEIEYLVRLLEESDDALPKIGQAVAKEFSDKTLDELRQEIKK